MAFPYPIFHLRDLVIFIVLPMLVFKLEILLIFLLFLLLFFFILTPPPPTPAHVPSFPEQTFPSLQEKKSGNETLSEKFWRRN